MQEAQGCDFNKNIATNQKADSQATQAQTEHSMVIPCNVGVSQDHVTLMHLTGQLVEGDIHHQTMAEESSSRVQRQHKKESRGKYLCSGSTSYTKSQLPCASRELWRVQQWLHMARYKSQTPNTEKMHLYCTGSTTTLPASIGSARSSMATSTRLRHGQTAGQSTAHRSAPLHQLHTCES